MEAPRGFRSGGGGRWNPALLGLLALWLGGCALQAQAPETGLPLAAFSPRGALWSWKGRVYLALAPGLRAEPIGLPGPPSALGWNTGEPWAALPASGWLISLLGPSQVVRIGPASAMSAQAVYLADGAVVGYQGELLGRLELHAPVRQAIWSGGTSYLLTAHHLWAERGSLLAVLAKTSPADRFLALSPSGPAAYRHPTVWWDGFRYSLQHRKVNMYTPGGRLLRGRRTGAGLLGLVGNLLVGIGPGAQIRAWSAELRRAEGTAR